MTTYGKYIYGFIRTDKPEDLGAIGIDQGEVHILPYQEIAALVSDLSFVQFDSLSKEALLRNLAVYQSVIEKVMQRHDIVPVKFGTMVQGEEEVNRILEKGYSHIGTSLRETENKIELDVAALWNNFEAILKEIGEEDRIKALKQEAASKSPEEVFKIKIKVGRIVKELLDSKREEHASLILDALKKEAENHRPHDIMDDSMILNAAFLIDKDKQEILEEKVDGLDRYYRDKINFRIAVPIIGPDRADILSVC